MIGSRPPPKITWHLVGQSNQIIDLVSKKHPSSGQTAGQSTSNVQIILDEETHLSDEYAIFQHPLPSTTHQSKHFKSAGQPVSQFAASPFGAANVNNPNADALSATSATKLVTKQPFIFTIDYPLLSQDGNTSSSVLKLRLSQRMHLNRLVCRATNYEMQRDSELEDQQLLNILCKCLPTRSAGLFILPARTLFALPGNWIASDCYQLATSIMIGHH